jgi:hypothetical protein
VSRPAESRNAVTDNRPAPVRPADAESRNAVTDSRPDPNYPVPVAVTSRSRRSDAVTDSRRVAPRAGPVTVTCKICRSEIPPEQMFVVYAGHNYRRGLRSGDPICFTCGNADKYLLPFRYGMPREWYAHRCPYCTRSFYGGTRRRYCSETCGERTRRERRTRPRATQGPRSCWFCERKFTPTRADARYCTSACRQADYRRRKAGAP